MAGWAKQGKKTEIWGSKKQGAVRGVWLRLGGQVTWLVGMCAVGGEVSRGKGRKFWGGRVIDSLEGGGGLWAANGGLAARCPARSRANVEEGAGKWGSRAGCFSGKTQVWKQKVEWGGGLVEGTRGMGFAKG